MNLSDIPKNVINTMCDNLSEHIPILKLALALTPSPTQDRTNIINKLSTDIPKAELYTILGVYLKIVNLFMETTVKEFTNTLLEIGFTQKFIQNFPLIDNRDEVISNIVSASSTNFVKLTTLRWRIDISLTNSALFKQMPANVILHIEVSKNRRITIELDYKTFHKLRFNIAIMLKEMSALKHSILSK